MGGIANASECGACPAGRYCSFSGPVRSDKPPNCSAGYICLGGSTTPTPIDNIVGYECPPGYYCLEGNKTLGPVVRSLFRLKNEQPASRHYVIRLIQILCTKSIVVLIIVKLS